MVSDNIDVSQVGEQWGRVAHRKASVERCENGYTVDYTRVADEPTEYHRTVKARRVFITNSDMLEFLELYFRGEPKP